VSILHLTLKKKWFDLIKSGEKTEEYREIKDYWTTRLKGKEFDIVRFRNGYQKNAPQMEFAIKDIWIGYGRVTWGAPRNHKVYIINLGLPVPF